MGIPSEDFMIVGLFPLASIGNICNFTDEFGNNEKRVSMHFMIKCIT